MLINVTLSRSGASLKTVQKSSLLLPNRRIRICLRLVKIYFVVEKYPDLLIETWSATLLPLIKNIWGGAFIKSRTNSGKSRHPDTTFWNLNEWNLRSYSSTLLTILLNAGAYYAEFSCDCKTIQNQEGRTN